MKIGVGGWARGIWRVQGMCVEVFAYVATYVSAGFSRKIEK